MVQGQSHNNVVKMFRGSEVEIASEWRHQLGVAIESLTIKISQTKLLVEDWIKGLISLTRKAEP